MEEAFRDVGGGILPVSVVVLAGVNERKTQPAQDLVVHATETKHQTGDEKLEGPL